MTVRRVGVEEELLLTDAASGELRPVAHEIIPACLTSDDGLEAGRRAEVKHEFFLSQVEVASRPHVHLDTVRAELADARLRVAHAGAAMGVTPMAVPGPVLATSSQGAETLSPGPRYEAVDQHYAEVARHSLMCATHIHVEVADEQEGVAVIDRVRPWIPVLIALTANSPYWRGRDVGYASWRSRVWNTWPSGGPAELFGDPAGYHAAVEQLVRSGAVLDRALVNFDVRLSDRYPTVEFRVADVCTDLEDALLMASLTRALVTHSAAPGWTGGTTEGWRVEELRGAAWRAARFGLDDTLISPESRELVDAHTLVRRLVTLLSDPLEEAGDLTRVTRAVTALEARGNGAARQRAAFAETGDLSGVVADLQARTLAP